MSQIQDLINEIQAESVSTQKILERIPADKFDWTPHEKSQSLKHLATHIAGISAYPGIIMTTSYLDFMEKRETPVVNSTEDLVQLFQQNTEKSIEALKNASEDELSKEWTMKAGDHIIVQNKKGIVMRSMAMSHLYHHRAQLGMYLRLLNVPIPGMYGPSADDRAAQK